MAKEALKKANIDYLVNFAAIGTSLSCEPFKTKCKQVLAVDLRSKTINNDLRAAKEAGVGNLITDALPESFGEEISNDLVEHFTEKVIYLPPVLTDIVIRGVAKKTRSYTPGNIADF